MKRKKARLRVDWAVLLPIAAAIVRSYDTSVSLRQLFYRLVAAQYLPNTQNAYKALSHHTAKARRDGYADQAGESYVFPDLIDRGRAIHRYKFWRDIPDALDYAVDTFRLDRTTGQKYAIYLGVEKSGIVEQLMAWFGERGIPVVALGGYSSQSYVDEVVAHVAADGRPSILIIAGDFDASGDDIVRDFLARTGCWDEDHVRRVALTLDQVIDNNLAVAEGKEHDTRKNKFHDKYKGDPRYQALLKKHNKTSIQVELDALEPEALHALFEAEVSQWWDAAKYEAFMAHEEKERRRFQNLVRRWKKTL